MKYPAIRDYLKLYPDDRLAALLAHTEDGKLSFFSCCCLVGAINADHALCGIHGVIGDNGHYIYAKNQYGLLARMAEVEFYRLGLRDPERREKILPLIREEMARREAEKVEHPSLDMEEVMT